MEEGKKNPLLSGVMAGYMILLIHLLLVIILATAVVFIQALSEYIEYILAGGFLLIIGSGAFFYHLIKRNGRQILNTLRNPSFQGQNVEVSLLGGLASISINNPGKGQPIMIDHQTQTLHALPEHPPSASPGSELLRLSDLYDRGLINKDDFLKLKDDLLTSHESHP
ncbi:MAG: SHOCT domain-containing protein [Deltaproteobacteria bacterium]|nr:SHOCT domain-containing protein [Deltaproteobacteria bacterium]